MANIYCALLHCSIAEREVYVVKCFIWDFFSTVCIYRLAHVAMHFCLEVMI